MKYSKITYTYASGDTVFSIPFEYTKKEFIHIYINEEELENDYIIENQTVIINKSLESGTKVTIQRITALIQLVDFSSRNNLKSFDLNLAFTQILHLMQEQEDTFNEIMPQTNEGDWNALNKRITNLAPAVNGSDAVRKDQILSLTYEGMEELENNVNEIIESKGQANGYASLDENGLIPQKQIPFDYVRFCVNSGVVDENGEPDLLRYEEETRTITVKSPFIYTTASGKTYECTDDLSIVLDETSTGNVRIWVYKDNDGTFYLKALSNNIFIQKSEPKEAKENDVWINTSVAPETQKIKAIADWKIFEGVEIGAMTGLEARGGQSLKAYPYNINRDIENIKIDISEIYTLKANADFSNCTRPYVTEMYINKTSWYKVWSNGFIEQGGEIAPTATTQEYILKFPKKFVNTPLGIFKNYGINISASQSPMDYRYSTFYSATNSEAKTRMADNPTCVKWVAFGY